MGGGGGGARGANITDKVCRDKRRVFVVTNTCSEASIASLTTFNLLMLVSIACGSWGCTDVPMQTPSTGLRHPSAGKRCWECGTSAVCLRV